MVRATIRPPYLDQLEHAERQRRARGSHSAANGNVLPAGRWLSGQCKPIKEALVRRPSDWQIRFLETC